MTDESVTLRRVIEATVCEYQLMLHDKDESIKDTARAIAREVLQRLADLDIEVVKRN